jgi:hypothetical protein
MGKGVAVGWVAAGWKGVVGTAVGSLLISEMEGESRAVRTVARIRKRESQAVFLRMSCIVDIDFMHSGQAWQEPFINL